MNLTSDLQTAEQWAGYIGGILSAVAGKGSSSSTPTASTAAKTSTASVSIGVDPLPELTAGLTSLTTVAKLFTQWDAEMNTPAMVNASVAEKLQAFRDRVNRDLATGDEADLEKLEAQ